jgi:hypothetical protein
MPAGASALRWRTDIAERRRFCVIAITEAAAEAA